MIVNLLVLPHFSPVYMYINYYLRVTYLNTLLQYLENNSIYKLYITRYTMKGKFIRIKPCKMIIAIDNRKVCYPAQLSKKADLTYSHVHKLLKELNEAGIVTKEKDGRKLIIKLTERGFKLKTSLEEVFEILRKRG